MSESSLIKLNEDKIGSLTFVHVRVESSELGFGDVSIKAVVESSGRGAACRPLYPRRVFAHCNRDAAVLSSCTLRMSLRRLLMSLS